MWIIHAIACWDGTLSRYRRKEWLEGFYSSETGPSCCSVIKSSSGPQKHWQFYTVSGRGSPNGMLAAQSSSCSSERRQIEVSSVCSCRAGYYGCNDRRAVDTRLLRLPDLQSSVHFCLTKCWKMAVSRAAALLPMHVLACLIKEVTDNKPWQRTHRLLTV